METDYLIDEHDFLADVTPVRQIFLRYREGLINLWVIKVSPDYT